MKRTCSLLVLSLTLAGLAHGQVNIYKADNSTALDAGSSWMGGVAPVSTNVATWSGSYAAASLGAALPGSAVSWGGISIGTISGAGAGTVVSIGGTGNATTGSALSIGTNGIDMSAASSNAVINSATVAFSGIQTWNLASGLNLRFGTTGTGGYNATAVTSGSDGVISISGGGVVDLNEGGSGGFSDAAGFTGFGGKWTVNTGATLRGLRNGATAFGSNTATNAITLNGGTLADGGISGSQGNWTWTTPITLATGTSSTIDNQIYSGSSRTLLLNGTIGGSGNLAFNNTGPGTMSADTGFILAANNTMSGILTINSGAFLRVGGVGGTSTATGASANGTLGTASVVNNGTLTLSHSNTWIFANAVSGSGSLRIGGVVSGAGSQVVSVSGANSYTGTTTVGAGTLELDGSIAAGSAVTVQSSAVLNGNGTINGPVTVSGGGTLAAGTAAAIGTLSISNALTMSSTSTNLMRLQKYGTTLTADLIRGLTNLIYNGTLVVTTNVGTPLALGDTFAFFQSATYNGGFSNYVLPALPTSWTWNTSNLMVNGSIQVVAVSVAPPPAITGVSPTNGSALGGTVVTITGSNFISGAAVSFGGVAAASVTFNSSSQLVATTPALSAGVVNVQVTNPDSQSATTTNAFTVYWVPAASTVYAWYAGDSSLVVDSDNYSVTAWNNLGTANTNSTYTQTGRNLTSLTGSPQKLYLRTPGGTTVGAINFGGSDGIWTSKTSFGILTNNRTLIVYARISNSIPEGFLFDSTSTSPGYTRALVWSNYWRVSVDSSAGTQTAPAVTNVWQVHSFVLTTNSGTPLFQHFINGALVGSVTVASPSYLSGLMIGANVSQALGIQASVAEFLVFNSALDGATRTNVENYLTTKWSGVVADTNAPALVPYVYTPVFISGTGYPEYRIPAMCLTTNGTVIAVADGRQGNGDIPNPLDCVCKRSFDNGNTWDAIQVIADYGSNQNTNDVDTYPAYGITNHVPRKCAGDSSLLLDRTNGRVWVLYDNGAPTTNQFNSATRAIKLEMRYSDDNGATWSSRIDVEALNPGLRPTITAAPEFLTGPGNGLQLSSGTNAGRLIFPIYVYGSPYYSALIYSDDHGTTWKFGGIAGNGGGEVQMVETPNGGLLASMRDNTFSWSGVRTFSRSTDGGLTWGALFTIFSNPATIPDPACQGSILRLSTTNDSNASRIVFANCDSSSSRVAMTLRISYDEGQTWPVSNLVYSGVSGYSALTKLATGEIGLLNEVNSFARIDFVRRSVTTVSGGSDSLPAYTVWAGNIFSPAQLMNPAISGPNADPDGDGFSNYQEFIAGTNPLDATSHLQLNLVPPTFGTNALLLMLNAVSNKSYTIQCRSNLVSNTWQKFQDIPTAASNSVLQLPVNPTNASQFFRLVTPQLP